jgi:alkylation response protein AidB-like acyl-CoA dehydrogenase
VDFRFNSEEQWARETALALVPKLAARAARYDTDLAVPEEDLEDLRKSGLLTLPIPKLYGGRGSGWFDSDNPMPYLLAIKTLATGNPATAHFFQVHCHAMQALHDSLDRASQITGQALLGVEYDPTVKH